MVSDSPAPPTPVRVPIATYRLQFNRDFTFRDATAITDYLHALGISDCYASSYLRAVPASPHGYDVADPTQLNPEIGSSDDYRRWIDAMRSRGMGHVLDLVPNHMGIAMSANPWWLDVLENGPSSRFAHIFDIEWRPVKDELADKVLIPILGNQYGEALEAQQLRLAYRQDGSFVIEYFDNVLPVAPDTYATILGLNLGAWVAARTGTPHADELQSIVGASRNLPPRDGRDPEAILTRAREKEVLKRRIASVVDANPDVRAYVDELVRIFNGTIGDPRSFDPLDALLHEQSYRLAHWRVASEEINYRRFFDVNQLAAVRMEDPAVFDEVHRFVFELIEQGGPTGLRVDHVDGLYAPAEYLQRLQDRHGPLFVIVEKILGRGEELPEWPVAGTTGYEFAAAVNNLFVDARNERALTEIYRRLTQQRISFDELAYRSKKQVMHETMSGDINSLGHRLNRFSERNRHFRDFTLYSLISTLKEVIACFPVYRTYVTAGEPVSDADRDYIREAIRCAKRRGPGPLAAMVFEFVERLLLKQTPMRSEEESDERNVFIGKFQQITSPVAAKGIEDTALYVYNRLLSLNEVGSDPTQFGIPPADLHAWFAARQRRWPTALSATSTHDTKRGEDVRARLNVLSELPGAWKAAVIRWRAINRRYRVDINGTAAPDLNEEYFLYQTLIGSWPFDASDGGAYRRYVERIRQYMVKALREAKVHTSWLSPDETYEAAVRRFVDAVLDRRRANLFLESFEPLQARIAEFGICNSLSQLLLKITAPGVPDFYQGTECWALNLVDPDNRRPVDYEARRRALAAIDALDPRTAAAALFDRRADGHVKLFVTRAALRVREAHRDLFESGEYIPLGTAGTRRECVFAFARRVGENVAITIVPRLVASLSPDGAVPPLGRGIWLDTRIELPAELSHGQYVDAFTAAPLAADVNDGRASLAVADALAAFPVALCVRAGAR